MWELDKKLLQAHALPLVVGYAGEVATAMRALDMDEGQGPQQQQQKQQQQGQAVVAVEGGGMAAAPAGLAGAAASGRPPLARPKGAAPVVPLLGRRMLRSGSSSLQRLVKMVGRSRQIYKVLCVGVLLQ